MDIIRQTPIADEEPVGIVIAGASLPEERPRFRAYVWAQDDEPVPTGPAPVGAAP